MTQDEKKRLKFRRQYILSPEEIECPFLFHRTELPGGYKLYTHIDLITTEYSCENIHLLLLGEMFDYEVPEKSNSDILAEIIDTDFSRVVNSTSKYTGRFVIIYTNQDQIKVMHDLTSARKIYYYKSDQGIFCSSQVQLLAHINQLEKTKDKSKLRFYSSDIHKILNYSNIGNTTIYDEIFQLLPNHHLDVINFKITRYWINKPCEELTVDQTAGICARMLNGYMKAISLRYKIMLPLTAGKDSRTLLSAARDIKDTLFCYINKEKGVNNHSNDIKIPKKLLANLNLDFHILDPYIKIDKDFEEIYYSNNESASPFYLPHIYNYYKNFPDKVNLPGNFVASGYDMYGKYNINFTAKKLAKLNWVKHYQFAVDYYQKWLDECKDFCLDHGIHLSILFYWEERLANWGTQVHSDKDIAQEDIVPFNSRLLVHYFLSVDSKLIDRPFFPFFKRIMKKLWPEVTLTPFNPSIKLTFTKILYFIGILDLVRRILSQTILNAPSKSSL